MKKILTIAAMILCLCFVSCIKKGEEITGDKFEDIENITQKDDAAGNLPVQENEKDDILPKTDALSEIQKISGTLKFEESLNDDIANEFVLAIKNKDTKALSQFCGGESEYFDFLNDTQIIEYVILPFEIPKENINTEFGYYVDYASHYVVNLKYISDTNNDLFPKGQGEKLFYLQIDEYNPFGNAVCAFVPFEDAVENVYSKEIDDKALSFCDMFLQSLTLETLKEGRNDAVGFDLTNEVHFITHLVVDFTDKLPPYSLNEINEFVSKTFDENKGITKENIALWASAREYELSLDMSDDSIYSDLDKKILGCSYAHGGNTVMYDVTDDKKDGNDREITIVCYSDFAKITKSKKLTFYFDKSGEYPKLLGVEQKSFNDNKIASMGF